MHIKTFKAWSYSRWSTHDKCPFQAKCKFLDKLPEPPAPALEKGKKAHDVLARFMGGEGMDPDEIPGHEHFGDLMNYLRSLDPLVEQQWGFTDKWLATDWFGTTTWFRAVLDVATVYADNTADVVDFKTGKASAGHEDQAELYAIALFQRYPNLQEINVRFWYLDLGSESIFCYDRKQLSGFKSKWEAKVEPMLLDRTFAPRPGYHCKWCAHSASQSGTCTFG
jgi:hypothetical protein